MSDSEDDSILDNLQKTRELWSNKSDGGSPDFLIPKSPISPTKLTKSPSPVMENHVNGDQAEGDIVRFEDRVDDDFELPDVKSMKSQWEKGGSVPAPKKKMQPVERPQAQSNPPPDLVPVNRESEEKKEEYEVQLGKLREKFEKEAKAASAKVVWSDGPKASVSKAAVDERVNMFEGEIEAQNRYQSTKEEPVEMPAVELSSIKKQFEQRKDERLVIPKPKSSSSKPRQTSLPSDNTAPAAEIVRYDDPPTQEVKYEIELSSLRKRFERGGSTLNTPVRKTPVQKKVSSTNMQKPRAASESENVIEIVKSSDPRNDEMIGEESVKTRLARYKAMTEAAKPQRAPEKLSYKRRSTADLVIKKPVEEEFVLAETQEIVRSPPAGTKEKLDYKTSIDLEQTRQLFEQRSVSPTRVGRSSRPSSASSQRRSPRSQSTPSPINRASRSSSATSSKSPSPARQASRSSISSSGQSSGRGSPKPGSKGTKKFGDPDVVVLEHTEVNYYYEEGKRLSTKIKGPDDLDKEAEDMSNGEVIKPTPAGTKEDVDFVPSINLHSVRNMFENPQDEEYSRGRALPPKKTIIIERQVNRPDTAESSSPERNPEIVRSTAAGTREAPLYEISADLKAARSKFESPHRQESYVPRNKIQQREEEARKQRAAVAAASPRSSESSDTSFEVVKTTEAGSKEKPDYHVDLKTAKQMFEGGTAPMPVKRETSTNRVRQETEIKGDIVRPEPAGTKEVVEIHASKDMKTAKQKFESPTAEEPAEEPRRKSPIDIQEEARIVMRKEKEVKEEVQKPNEEDSDSEQTDTEGEAVLERDSDHEPLETSTPRQNQTEHVEMRSASVSSEELVETDEAIEEERIDDVIEDQEEEEKEEESNEEPAAAVVPVRVAIPDLTGEQIEKEPESEQNYGTYAKVIDYNEEIQSQPQASSDSESDKDEIKGYTAEEPSSEIYKDEQIIEDDGLKHNGMKEDNADSSYESTKVTNHLDDSPLSDDQKGISSNSSNQDDSQQQLSLSSSSQQEDIAAEEGSGYLQ